MEFLSTLIAQALGSVTGTLISVLVGGIVLAVLCIPLLMIQQRFFPKLSENQIVKVTAIIIGGILLWFVIPWAFWYLFLKAAE